MKKIHYTIYNGNYEKGQDACPMCNDQKQYPYQYLTTDIDEVTCKKCLKSKIKSANFALEMIPLMSKQYMYAKKKMIEDFSHMWEE
jgi:hypothetical protein